jgi:sulfatase maturation enzyme AslB (radical SAM superfamily)
LYNEVSDKSKLFLNIVTNGSVFPDSDILEKLKQFNTTITFSLDAVGELANVVRWGVDWELIERNITQWRSFADENKNVFLCTNSTISIMNVNMISDLIAFCETHRLRYGFSELTYPEYLSIYQLPVNVREQWKIGNAAFDRLLLSNMRIDAQFEKFLVAMHTLDGYQQVSFSTANKEMYDLVSTYTEQK